MERWLVVPAGRTLLHPLLFCFLLLFQILMWKNDFWNLSEPFNVYSGLWSCFYCPSCLCTCCLSVRTYNSIVNEYIFLQQSP